MRQILTVVLVLAGLVSLGLALGGCESADNAAARRANAEAAAERAAAEAYQVRQQADTQAAAERSAIRQAEANAAHQRTIDLLPFVLAILGALVLAGLGLLAWWDLRAQRAQPAVSAPATDSALLFYLERLRLEQAEQWRALAQLARRTFPDSGDNRREVVIYTDRQQ